MFKVVVTNLGRRVAIFEEPFSKKRHFTNLGRQVLILENPFSQNDLLHIWDDKSSFVKSPFSKNDFFGKRESCQKRQYLIEGLNMSQLSESDDRMHIIELKRNP